MLTLNFVDFFPMTYSLNAECSIDYTSYSYAPELLPEGQKLANFLPVFGPGYYAVFRALVMDEGNWRWYF